MLDKIGRFFAKPATKQILAAPANAEKAALLHRLADNLAYLYGKAEEVRKVSSTIKSSSDREAAGRFTALKNEIMDEMTDQYTGPLRRRFLLLNGRSRNMRNSFFN